MSRRHRRRLSKKERKIRALALVIVVVLVFVYTNIKLILDILKFIFLVIAILFVLYIFARKNTILSPEVNGKIIAFIDFINPFGRKERAYKKTEYYKQTHLSYKEMKSDVGRVGEYKIFNMLNSTSDNKKFIFNCYLPKDDEETTEVDVIMIHNSGVYIFESKNYSGWIFGTDNHIMWTQTLPVGRNKSQKFNFYNPVMQNNLHIKWLSRYLNDSNIKYHSYIVFGENCDLRDITVTSNYHYILRINELVSSISKAFNSNKNNLSDEQINEIYEKLYPLTQVSEEIKNKHIENISQNH